MTHRKASVESKASCRAHQHNNLKMDEQQYKVVVNHEGQHSIWPRGKGNALGWCDQGFVGTKAECLEHIRSVWTDMRPVSLRLASAHAVHTIRSLQDTAAPNLLQRQALAV